MNKMENNMESVKEDNNDEVKSECLCCNLSVSLKIFGGILWTLGLLIGANIIIMFYDDLYPWWQPVAQFCLFIFYLFAMIIICLWYCNDNKENRRFMVTAGWFMLISTTLIIFWNIIYIQYMIPKSEKNVGVGSGSKDDPENYDPINKTQYLLGYVIWGIIIITLIIFFQVALSRYVVFK